MDMSNSTTGDFLDKLSSLKRDFKIYVPSRKKDVVATPISLKQQKEIISTTVGGIRGALEFTKIINEMILENIDEKDFYTFDRTPLVLGLRYHCLGDKVKTGDGKVVSLKSILTNIKTKEAKFTLTKKASIDSLKVQFRIPTIEQETIVIKKCILEIDKVTEEDITKAMGMIYIFELIKYIDSVSIGGEEALYFNDLKVMDRVKILEQLPLEVYDKLSTFIEPVNKYDIAILNTDDGTIAIDTSLFDAPANA